MRSGDLLSEGIIYVREGVGLVLLLRSRWRSRGRERWAGEWNYMYAYIRVCAGEG